MVKKKRAVRRTVRPKSIISDEIIIPNHSGMLDAGKVHRVATDDLDPVNKKYVDDIINLLDNQIQLLLDLKLNLDASNDPITGDLDLNENLTLKDSKSILLGDSQDVDISFNGDDLIMDYPRSWIVGTNPTRSGFNAQLEVYNNGADVRFLLHEDAGTHDTIMHFRTGFTDWAIRNTGQFFIWEREGLNLFDLNGIGNVRTTGSLEVADKGKMTAIGGFAVKLTNKTGANSVSGQLVKADTANDDAIVLTGALDDECFGVFLDDGVTDGSEAWIVVSGIADVRFNDNTTAVRGNWVGTGTAGTARTQAAPPALGVAAHFEEIGHVIETVNATGPDTFIKARCILQFN